MTRRQRLDSLVVERGLAPSRNVAQGLVRAGQVLVDEVPIDKPGTTVRPESAVRLRGELPRFVSRAGEKLAAALDAFEVDPSGRVAADLGAGTGGFTDCLLQRGAARVFAVDVGYGQLAWTLRNDPRVVVMERTNARYLDTLPEPVSLVVGDLSFISLAKVLPAILRIAAPGADGVFLVKPQFEAGRGQVGKGGVVRDPDIRAAAIASVVEACRAAGALVLGSIASPVPGAKKGNVEELIRVRLPG